MEKVKRDYVAYISTYPPRQCGIATFTADLTSAMDDLSPSSVGSRIVAINPSEINQLPYQDKVLFRLCQTKEEDYAVVAKKINNKKEIKLVNIQHEFGIFGGEYGSYLLTLLEKLRKPVVITLHTVLPAPNDKLREVVIKIARYVKGIVVMTQSSKEILCRDYGLDETKIQVIPHGIHHVPYTDGVSAKASLGLSGKLVLSTFGLLSQGKGIEYVLEALPPVVKKFPDVRFLIIGATHPEVLKQEGERYRNFLAKKVYDLGLRQHVLFYNTYLELSRLLEFLEATDIYISPSLDPNQTVSGTLSYALGSGRPVISTAFAQAKQDVTEDVGVIVGFRDPSAFTKAINKLLKDKNLRSRLSRNAYFRTRHMTFQNVSLSYLRYFAKFVPRLVPKQGNLPPIKLGHLSKLTDDFGVIQFAKLTDPDISTGYTLDDNARALTVAVAYHERTGAQLALKLVQTYLKFVELTNKPDGYFYNYVGQGRKIAKAKSEESLEETSARGLYALARTAISPSLPLRIKKEAHALFQKCFKNDINFIFPRAIAIYIKALCALQTKWNNPDILSTLRSNCEKLVALYDQNHTDNEWEWFEHILTYSNATIPEALALGFKATKEKRYLEVAEKTLNFLIAQTFKENTLVPIGQSGWFSRGGVRQYHDQQPEDATATVIALNTMFTITHDRRYKDLAFKAFNWFLGDNLLQQVVYDRTTGGCYDGVGEKAINLNQGAESTISYLLARLSFKD